MEYSGKERHPRTRRVLKKVLYGKAPPGGPTPYTLVLYKKKKAFFFTEKVPLSYTLYYDKWYPFHISSLEHFIFFICCKYTDLKI